MLQFALEPLLAAGPGGLAAGESLPALSKLLTTFKMMHALEGAARGGQEDGEEAQEQEVRRPGRGGAGRGGTPCRFRTPRAGCCLPCTLPVGREPAKCDLPSPQTASPPQHHDVPLPGHAHRRHVPRRTGV